MRLQTILEAIGGALAIAILMLFIALAMAATSLQPAAASDGVVYQGHAIFCYGDQSGGVCHELASPDLFETKRECQIEMNTRLHAMKTDLMAEFPKLSFDYRFACVEARPV